MATTCDVANLDASAQAASAQAGSRWRFSAETTARSDEVIGAGGLSLDVLDYAEHAVAVGGISAGADATAAAYVEVKAADGTVHWGVGLHESILTSSLRAVVSALNRHRDPA